MEDKKNIVVMCKKCGDMRKHDWQARYKDTKIKAGDLVKLCFMEGKFGEHMWVEVTETLPNDRFKGRVDNEPLLLKKVKLNKIVGFCKNDVEDMKMM
jgi:uncharacterized protein YegJ (DUF2314 family)